MSKSDAAVAQLHNTIDECSVHIENTVQALEALDQNRRNLENRLVVNEIEAVRVEGLKQKAEDDQPKKSEKMKKLNDDLRRSENEMSEAENEGLVVNNQYAEKRDQIEATKQLVSSFTDNTQAFLRRVGNNDVRKLYDFMRRSSHVLRGEVYGPGNQYSVLFIILPYLSMLMYSLYSTSINIKIVII